MGGRVSGQKVLISGAAQGLGAAAASALACDGARVLLTDINEAGVAASAEVAYSSDESRFMTGAELKLDGGISAM